MATIGHFPPEGKLVQYLTQINTEAMIRNWKDCENYFKSAKMEYEPHYNISNNNAMSCIEIKNSKDYSCHDVRRQINHKLIS